MRFLPVALLALALAAPPALALPTPGVNCQLSDAATGRLFPEPMETNDFISFEEARCGLDALLQEAPDWLKLDVVGQSAGWDSIMGGHQTFDVFVVRVSNYAGPLPDAQKVRLVFQLSIHGNEKGGREGGLRVIEDFVRDVGLAQEFPELREQLDWMELLFVFPNPDGWMHEELPYRANDACYFSVTCPALTQPGQPGVESQNFVRVNGHGVDVNRQWPTTGWSAPYHNAMHETEATTLVDYLMKEANLKYASDIHGMLNPADGTGAQNCIGGTPPEVGGFDATCFGNALTGSRGHFVLTMLPAGRQDPREMTTNTALAQLVKERLNGDPYFAGWNAAPNSLQGAWGGEFDSWGTVWDTIGYTDSGFASDFYAQDTGLNVPGVDFEMSYNHVTVDDYYPGPGQVFNDYHVRAVRDIVRAFMNQAAQDIQVTLDAKGTRTAWLHNPADVTNEGDMSLPDWALDNALDDAIDAAHVTYHARPNDYFVDLKAKLQGGTLDELMPATLASQLGSYTNLVIAGAAYDTIKDDAAAKAAVKAWVEQGGHLVLTDEALQLLPALGAAGDASVQSAPVYAGHTNFIAADHLLAQGILGLARQTFEPVALGFSIQELSAPSWFVDASAFQGDVVGVMGDGQGASPDPAKVNFGVAAVGKGTVSFLGALLPTPHNEDSAPYGVDAYATTYTGNQLLRNALGWEEVVDAHAAPEGVSPTSSPPPPPARTPALGALAVALAIAGMAFAVGRRRRLS
jgi:zinc carboxypeptidase